MLTTRSAPSIVSSTRGTAGGTTTTRLRATPKTLITSWLALREDATSVAPRWTARRSWLMRKWVRVSPRSGRRSSTETISGIFSVGGVARPATCNTSTGGNRPSIVRPRLRRHSGDQSARRDRCVSLLERAEVRERNRMSSHSPVRSSASARSVMELPSDSSEPSRSRPTRRLEGLTNQEPTFASHSSSSAKAWGPTHRKLRYWSPRVRSALRR